ncbi:hypothetical protein [Actinoplanes sp. NBRC 101535]|uniref:hypothetical protein n=1 Tax=Actinoplanes sp. NBRC 101535 TaxID=3032196 RepID=UPI0024A0B0CA|nr:hypothetical protein [Actinoplanes sp. NBRC 101535]GLY03818.1 hypothetical protein Acsp01_41970 [Actinoplanes sp. NBRC 101535]
MSDISLAQPRALRHALLTAVTMAVVIGLIGVARHWTGEAWVFGVLVGVLSTGFFIATRKRRAHH